MLVLILKLFEQGSVFEFAGIISLLTSPKSGQAFHVVAPSIPGYTFSSAPKKNPLQLETVAFCFNQVMLELGYSNYVAQGGDVNDSPVLSSDPL